MSEVLVIAGERLARYGFGNGHPWGPDRHAAFYREFESRGLERRCRVHDTRAATDDEILLFHTAEYLNFLRERSRAGSGYLDGGDTPAFNGVFEAAFPPVATVESPAFTPSTSGRREAAASGGERGWLTGLRTLRFVRSGPAGTPWSEREAREIAAFIRNAIDAGMAVPRTADEASRGATTRCGPGDFLIVTRERKHLGVYAAALHAAGLPVDVTGTLGEDQAEDRKSTRLNSSHRT